MEFGGKCQHELINILNTTEEYLNIRHNSCPQRSDKVNLNSNHTKVFNYFIESFK